MTKEKLDMEEKHSKEMILYKNTNEFLKKNLQQTRDELMMSKRRLEYVHKINTEGKGKQVRKSVWLKLVSYKLDT